MKIGPYDVTGEIGRGGIGIVYRGRRPDGGEVAIKVLRYLDEARAQRFERERRLLETLSEDEGFVPLIDSGMTPQGPFIVMPFLQGRTLRERIGRGALAVEDAIELGRSLAAALGKAHERGIVHRDMKPENIIYERDGSRSGDWGRPLILDLGLAKHWKKDVESHSISLSKTGETMGSVAYMAPEQQRDAKSVDPRADVFSLGAILYECLTGEPAFYGDSALEVFARILSGSFEPVRLRRSEVPVWLADTVERALANDPARRYRDGGALAVAIAARSSGVSRVPVRGLLAAVVVTALAGVAGAFFLSHREAPPPPSVPPRTPPPPPPRPEEKPVEKPLYESRTVRSTAVWGSYAGRHSAMVEKAIFSPDGKLVASCGLDDSVRVWDASDLHEILYLPGHTEDVTGIAFTPDGKTLVTGSRDHTVRVWDLASKGSPRVLDGHTEGVTCVAVSPDGGHLLTSGGDKRLGYWDLATGERIRWLEAGGHAVGDAAFLPDGRRALVVADDHALHLLDVETGETLRVFEPQTEEITGLAVSPDGKTAATGSRGTIASLWDVDEGKLTRTLRGHEHWTVSVTFSPDGHKVLTGSFDGKVRTFDAATGDLEATFDPDASWVLSARYSPDGKRIATAHNDATVRILDAATGREAPPSPGHHGRITSLALSYDGTRALTGSFDRTVRLWDATTGRELQVSGKTDLWINCVALSADGRHALSGGGPDKKPDRAELVLHDLAAGTSAPLNGPKLPVRAVAFAPNGLDAVSSGFSIDGHGEALRWSLGAEPSFTRMKGTGMGAFALAFLDDSLHLVEGTQLVAATGGGIRFWSLDAGALAAPTLSGTPATALAIAGGRLLAGETDGTIARWDLSEMATAVRFKAHDGPIPSLAVTADGKRALSAGADGTVRLWQLDGGGTELDEIDLASRGDRATAVAFYPDGRSFLVATVRGVVLRFEPR